MEIQFESRATKIDPKKANNNITKNFFNNLSYKNSSTRFPRAVDGAASKDNLSQESEVMYGTDGKLGTGMRCKNKIQEWHGVLWKRMIPVPAAAFISHQNQMRSGIAELATGVFPTSTAFVNQLRSRYEPRDDLERIRFAALRNGVTFLAWLSRSSASKGCRIRLESGAGLRFTPWVK